MPRTRVSSPFLRRMPPSSLWNWARVQNLARGVALSPNSAAIVSVRRVQPQQPSTCTVCEVSRWLAGPHHLGESSQDARGTDTSAGQRSRARHGGTYTKIGSIQRRLAWPLRKDDTQIREALHLFGRDAEATPPFALALRCHGQACPAPSLADAAVRHFGIGACTKPGTRRRLSPKLGGDCVSQAGPAPTAQHLRYARCRDGSPGPTTLVSSRERGTDTSAGQRSRASPAAAHILKLDRYRED
ncbi:hypothetical protein G5714_014691 [Onychostoma macrolepis]|uniref:Uncharacterized protein n=1 Tax=Onychostoma macrolepis TaxID=369639 RepID=A0A7J6C9H8_9TELE|nr:hypothetical protein G5714_014691 [Onychostoma macrolepis]